MMNLNYAYTTKQVDDAYTDAAIFTMQIDKDKITFVNDEIGQIYIEIFMAKC